MVSVPEKSATAAGHPSALRLAIVRLAAAEKILVENGVVGEIDVEPGNVPVGLRAASLARPPEDLAHDPAVEERRQMVRLEHGEEHAGREQFVLFFAKAHEDLQVLVIRRPRLDRHDRLAEQGEQPLFQRLGEVPGGPEPGFDVVGRGHRSPAI